MSPTLNCTPSAYVAGGVIWGGATQNLTTPAYSPWVAGQTNPSPYSVTNALFSNAIASTSTDYPANYLGYTGKLR